MEGRGLLRKWVLFLFCFVLIFIFVLLASSRVPSTYWMLNKLDEMTTFFHLSKENKTVLKHQLFPFLFSSHLPSPSFTLFANPKLSIPKLLSILPSGLLEHLNPFIFKVIVASYVVIAILVFTVFSFFSSFFFLRKAL